jgi:hypothetical protein
MKFIDDVRAILKLREVNHFCAQTETAIKFGKQYQKPKTLFFLRETEIEELKEQCELAKKQFPNSDIPKYMENRLIEAEIKGREKKIF